MWLELQRIARFEAFDTETASLLLPHLVVDVAQVLGCQSDAHAAATPVAYVDIRGFFEFAYPVAVLLTTRQAHLAHGAIWMGFELTAQDPSRRPRCCTVGEATSLQYRHAQPPLGQSQRRAQTDDTPADDECTLETKG